MMARELPIPDIQASLHSAHLSAQIAEEIAQQGPITLARYLSLALYAPQLGYYSAGSEKLGVSGDFVTAPEISPLFSRCVARQCQQVLSDIGSGDILELGAGTGAMAIDILEELNQQGMLPRRYFILEVSADLRERQQRLFQNKAPHFLKKVEWLNALPLSPIQGVIIGNEVMDAMPVHKFKIEKGIREFYVDYREGKFVWWVGEPSSEALIKRIRSLNIEFPEGYESEINVQLPAWIASLSDCLKQGLILLIDYGFPRHEFYHPERNRGTIMCHYRHRAHTDPLVLTGLQDITAHVDFSCVAEAARQQSLQVSGFVNQAAFLLNSGILDWIAKQSDSLDRYHTTQAIKRLTEPSEMGELFKVIALTRQYKNELIGFVDFNQMGRL